ncbi:uncharacterized protein B0I36DRAFT_57999 [Microdochium trichocladiopsis]|uniref:Uncharacterized protein n=1 Tax=Microdochium trichocladiopsis TaxID=1682393 RepID=A0A9P8XQ04_9PEZI|nr:uncharacterized protein B0I36DRAFT_57999 [Microdochium trichocladiopsis]KAH7010641.1 hypothetical protein B0I36DRAFT_57999 [Microdochium trichocladiopsis]
MAWVSTMHLAILAVVLASVMLSPVVLRLFRRNRESRPDGLQVVSDPKAAKFEIVAVHGLGAHPEYTWTCQAPANSTDAASVQRVHLLKDLLLPDFPAARILSFAHNSDWLINAPVKTAQEIGYMLLQQLKCHRSRHPVRFRECL